jgi:hypothetical protein
MVMLILERIHAELRLLFLPFATAVNIGLLYQPKMIYDGDYGTAGGMKIGRLNRSTRRKRAPAPLRPSQIPHDETRAAEVGSQLLTACSMAGPRIKIKA